jgi:hypothetical protein
MRCGRRFRVMCDARVVIFDGLAECPQGLKPGMFGLISARMNPCPDTGCGFFRPQ